MSSPHTEQPMPDVKHLCGRCGVTAVRVAVGPIGGLAVIVSPRGTAHYGMFYDATACGIDATGDGWWWPI